VNNFTLNTDSRTNPHTNSQFIPNHTFVICGFAQATTSHFSSQSPGSTALTTTTYILITK
jgi:hypothetical protein